MADTKDIRVKRSWETDLQWRSRLARLDAEARDRREPIVPVEAQQHATYRDAEVMHVETQTIAPTKRNVTSTPFEDLHHRGQITKEEFEAAMQIAMVIENMQRPVSLRCASMEARVDNSGAGRDVLIERLTQVQFERAYSEWRDRLPTPRQMIIDMITTHGSLAMKARRYRMGWPKARQWLFRSLGLWIEIRDRVMKRIDERDVEAAYNRLGEGKIQ